MIFIDTSQQSTKQVKKRDSLTDIYNNSTHNT